MGLYWDDNVIIWDDNIFYGYGIKSGYLSDNVWDYNGIGLLYGICDGLFIIMGL